MDRITQVQVTSTKPLNKRTVGALFLTIVLDISCISAKSDFTWNHFIVGGRAQIEIHTSVNPHEVRDLGKEILSTRKEKNSDKLIFEMKRKSRTYFLNFNFNHLFLFIHLFIYSFYLFFFFFGEGGKVKKYIVIVQLETVRKICELFW